MQSSIKATITLLLTALSIGAQAAPAKDIASFSACPQFFFNGAVPVVSRAQAGQQRALCFDAFAILHSGQSKTAVFVVEKLNKSALLDAKDQERTDRFYEEARLPVADRARLEDYKTTDFLNQRYDRGHLAPAADMFSENAMAQSFSLANMVPQAPKNNRGIWAKSVEKATRQYVMRAAGDVYVITGPHYESPVRTLGPNKVWIPSHLYKLVYDSVTQRAWAYWVENTDDAKMSRPISYQDLVQRTGIEFFPGVQIK